MACVNSDSLSKVKGSKIKSGPINLRHKKRHRVYKLGRNVSMQRGEGQKTEPQSRQSSYSRRSTKFPC